MQRCPCAGRSRCAWTRWPTGCRRVGRAGLPVRSQSASRAAVAARVCRMGAGRTLASLRRPGTLSVRGLFAGKGPENPMTYENPRDPRRDPNDPVGPRRPSSFSSWVPLALAAAVALAVIAMMYPRTTTDRTGDTTNTGPSVQTVTPSPSPSTSPPVPTPSPTTEPRPTQAPIQ